jgi:hypothetical protein
MDNLEYSIEALESKGLFYDKKITVYVEGKDDPIFWRKLFNIAEVDAHIEDVGGSKELEKYIDKLIEHNADFYIATDNDHSAFIKTSKSHKNIIKTYGYSIENSMYNINSVNNLISNLSKTELNLNEELNTWVERFSNEVFDLIIYDIANHKFNKGISVFGDNCFPFLQGQKSHKICAKKTSTFIKKISDSFTEDEIEEVTKLVKTSKKEFWFLIKGHFLTNAISNLIKNKIRKHTSMGSISLSHDFLYAFTVDCTQDWQHKIDIKLVIDEIKKIKNYA